MHENWSNILINCCVEGSRIVENRVHQWLLECIVQLPDCVQPYMWPDLKKPSFHTHTRSNLQFYQNWIAGSIHYHITLCALIRNQEFNFCGSLSLTLINLEWWFGIHGSLGMVFRWPDKPRRTGQGLSSSIWNAVSTRKVQYGPKWDLWLSVVFVHHLYSYTAHSHPPSYFYHLQYHYSHE